MRGALPCRAAGKRSVMAHWLKALGHAGAPLPDAWLEQGRLGALRRTGFPRRPRIVPGDRLVLYASVWRVVFAIAEAVEEPTDRLPVASDPRRWSWTVAIEPLVVVPVLSYAPPVEAIGVAARSMSQQSHIRLDERHFALAVEAIASVGA
jgi:hypothetical protein